MLREHKNLSDERRDCTELVRRVVEDFRGEAGAAGYEIEFHGNGSAQIETDAGALSRAVWTCTQ